MLHPPPGTERWEYGSSKPHTARYGKLFDQAQVRVHVGEAVLKALAVVAAGKARAAIALPDTPRHCAMVSPVRAAQERLGITMFWVGADGTVNADES